MNAPSDPNDLASLASQTAASPPMTHDTEQALYLFNFSVEQQQMLQGFMVRSAQALMSIMFSDPEKDQQIIRQHAYLKGQHDLLQEIFMFDNVARQQQEAKTQAALAAQLDGADKSTLSESGPTF